MLEQRFALSCQATVWLWTGKGAWHFVTLPLDTAAQLKEIDEISLQSLNGKIRRGWGAIPVRAMIGSSTWDTSIFPHKPSRSYLLPLKASIRKAENIDVNDTLSIELSIAMP